MTIIGQEFHIMQEEEILESQRVQVNEVIDIDKTILDYETQD